MLLSVSMFVNISSKTSMQILPFWFIYVAAGARLLGGLAYFRATLAGKARPKAMSWLIWSITPLITFFAELSVGAGQIAIVTLALGISPMLVVLAALKTDRRLFKLDRLDAFCIFIAVTGIVVWALSSDPILAIVLAITADAISCIPTIRKTIRKPETEYPLTYFLSASSMVIAILATKEVSFAAFAFPVFVLTLNSLMTVLAMRQYRLKH